MSTVSKRSRMRNTKTAKTNSAMSTEKATLTSTTSGMPRAPVAARIRPFSIDMKPTIWVTALRRVIIISNPSRMMASASARPSRVNGCRRHRDLENQHQRQAGERQADQQGHAHADDLLDIAVDAEAHDHLVQRHRNDDALEGKRQCGRDEQMRALLRPGFPAHRQRQQDRLRRKDVENGEDAVLVEQGEARTSMRPARRCETS